MDVYDVVFVGYPIWWYTLPMPIYTFFDKYDIYLSGASSIIDIVNPTSNSNKELIVFRDSYGSSLIPLLIDGY